MVAATTRLDEVFGALADSTRRAILTRLSRGSATVSELAEPFEVSLPAISKHLKVLERAGLLTRDIEGRIHRCRLEAQRMKAAALWIDQTRTFWEQQFASLERYLKKTAGRQTKRPKRKRKDQS